MSVYATLARFIRDSTAAGRALLTAATAGDQRTALGLGTAAQSASSDFAAAVHTHDDRYFTETEINSLLTSYLTVSAAGTTYLPLSGGSLTGPLSLGANAITSVGAITSSGSLTVGTASSVIWSARGALRTTTANQFRFSSVDASTGFILSTATNNTVTAFSLDGTAPASLTCGAITTSGNLAIRDALTAMTAEIFETYTSATSFGSLCLKATAFGHQIGSALGSAGGLNRAVQLGHFDSGGTFTSAISVATTGVATFAQAPVIASITNTGTITLPTSSTTLIGRDTTDTVTNKRIQRRIVSTTSATSLTPDISAADFYEFTALAAGLTINNPTGTPVNGELLNFRLQDNGTGRSITWGAQFRSMTATLPTTTVANKTHRILCEWNSGDSRWDCLAVSAEP